MPRLPGEATFLGEPPVPYVRQQARDVPERIVLRTVQSILGGPAEASALEGTR